MVSLLSLLIPIALSAVLVFIASSIIHMATPLHKHDLKRFPNEDAVMNALRPLNIAPGDYAMPMAGSMEAMKSPEFQAKYKAGPVGFITIRPAGEMSMTGNLINWFIYSLVVSFFTAYVCSRALAPGTDYLRVFQIAGCVSFMGYWLALPQNSIWWSRNWAWTFKSAIDGLLYAGLTGGAFGWLWPGV
jgi:hypothetical protein